MNTDTRAIKIASSNGQPLNDASLPNLGRLKPTEVYNTYWRFAAERQAVFFRRLENRPSPWTHDPVLRVHKFTNAYRASDRVSQYLLRRVIYRPDLPAVPEEVFFRILLFNVFATVGRRMDLRVRGAHSGSDAGTTVARPKNGRRLEQGRRCGRLGGEPNLARFDSTRRSNLGRSGQTRPRLAARYMASTPYSLARKHPCTR